jgi:hypothetical protein
MSISSIVSAEEKVVRWRLAAITVRQPPEATASAGVFPSQAMLV